MDFASMKATLTKKVGPFPTYVWVILAAVIAGLLWGHFKKKSSTDNSTDPNSNESAIQYPTDNTGSGGVASGGLDGSNPQQIDINVHYPDAGSVNQETPTPDNNSPNPTPNPVQTPLPTPKPKTLTVAQAQQQIRMNGINELSGNTKNSLPSLIGAGAKIKVSTPTKAQQKKAPPPPPRSTLPVSVGKPRTVSTYTLA